MQWDCGRRHMNASRATWSLEKHGCLLKERPLVHLGVLHLGEPLHTCVGVCNISDGFLEINIGGWELVQGESQGRSRKGFVRKVSRSHGKTGSRAEKQAKQVNEQKKRYHFKTDKAYLGCRSREYRFSLVYAFVHVAGCLIGAR